MREQIHAIDIRPPRDDRQARLNAWLAERNVKKKDLAAACGIKPNTLSMILSGERRPARRIQALIDLGIPAELLPTPSVDSSRNRSTTINGQSDSLDG